MLKQKTVFNTEKSANTDVKSARAPRGQEEHLTEAEEKQAGMKS